jgi:hypothetical protein
LQVASTNTSPEMSLLVEHVDRLFRATARCIDGLTPEQLNWKPPIPNANSLAAIASHILGNSQAWILGIIGEKPVIRDRDAEFMNRASTTSALISEVERLRTECLSYLESLPSSVLNEMRQPRPPLLGIGPADELTVRDALLRIIVHGRIHIGHLEITRDLVQAQYASG